MAKTIRVLWWIVAINRVIDINGNNDSCGTLRLTMITDSDGNIGAQMRLEVSDQFQTEFASPGYNKYRWLFKNNSTYLVIYRKGLPNYEGHKKYSESNLTLSLKFLSHADEGQYRIECWFVERPTAEQGFYYSNWVNLSLPVPSVPVTEIWDLNTSTCGRVELNKTTDPDGQIQASIRWHVSAHFRPYLERKMYRWLHTNKTNSLVVDLRSDKYSEVDHTLNIKHLTQGDEGDYYVECWTISSPLSTDFLKSNRVYVSLVTTIPSTSITHGTNPAGATSIISTGYRPSTGSENSQDGGMDTVVIVVALSAVVIVVIISGTVILIRRKKAEQEGRQILVKREESLERHAEKDFDTESVYNEITDSIPNQIADEYVDISLANSCSSRQLLVSSDKSPRLPKRPDASGNIKSNAQYEDNYAMIEARDGKKEQVEAEICVEYAKVVPKSNRNADGQECSSPVAEDNANTAEMTYAKVIPKSERQVNNESDDIEQACKHDKNKITAGELAAHNDAVVLDDTHVYSNTKQTAPLQKTKELTYVELDHSISRHTPPPPEEPSTRPNLAGVAGSSEYVSIDFNRQAFVAPVRKAPSSWYKRRNKKKKP